MSRQRYPEEFKIEAVKQVTEKGKPVADVAQRLGMSVHSLYAWIKLYSKPQDQRQQDDKLGLRCCSAPAFVSIGENQQRPTGHAQRQALFHT